MAKEKGPCKKNIAKNQILMQLKELKYELARKQKKLEKIQKVVEARRKSYNGESCSSSQGIKERKILKDNGDSCTNEISLSFQENFKMFENHSICNISDSDEPSVLSQASELKIPLDFCLNSVSVFPRDNGTNFSSDMDYVEEESNCSKHVNKIKNTFENVDYSSHTNETDALQNKGAVRRLSFTAISSPPLCTQKMTVKRASTYQEPFPEKKFHGQDSKIRPNTDFQSTDNCLDMKTYELDCEAGEVKIEENEVKCVESKCDVQEAITVHDNNENKVEDTSLVVDLCVKNAIMPGNNTENIKNTDSFENQKVLFEDFEMSENLKSICSRDFDSDFENFDVLPTTHASKSDKLNSCDISKLFSAPQFVPLSALVAKIEMEHKELKAELPIESSKLHLDSTSQLAEENAVFYSKTNKPYHLSLSNDVQTHNRCGSTSGLSAIENNESKKLFDNSCFSKSNSSKQIINQNNHDIQQVDHTVQRPRTGSDTFPRLRSVTDNKENCEPCKHNKQQKSIVNANLKPVQNHALYGLTSKNADNSVRKCNEVISVNPELNSETPLDILSLHPGYFVPLSKLKVENNTIHTSALKVFDGAESWSLGETTHDSSNKLHALKNIDLQNNVNHIQCDNDMKNDLDLLNDNFIFDTESSIPVEETNANLELFICSTQKSEIRIPQRERLNSSHSFWAHSNLSRESVEQKRVINFDVQDSHQDPVAQLEKDGKENTCNECTIVKSIPSTNVDCLEDDRQNRSNCTCRVIFQCSVSCINCEAHGGETKDVSAAKSEMSNIVNSPDGEEQHEKLLMCDDSFVVPLSSCSKFDISDSKSGDQRQSSQHFALDKSSAKSENNELLTQNLLKYLQDEDFEDGVDGISQPVGNMISKSPDVHQEWLRLSRNAKVNMKPAICIEDIIPQEQIAFTCHNDGMSDKTDAKPHIVKSECIDKIPTKQLKEMIAVFFSHTYFIILFSEFGIFVYQYDGLHWVKFRHWSVAEECLTICKGFHVQNIDHFIVGVILKTSSCEISNRFFLMNVHEQTSTLLETTCESLCFKDQTLLPYISVYSLDGLAFISSVMTGYSPIVLNEFCVDDGKFKLVSCDLDFIISPHISVCTVEFFPYFVTLKSGQLSMWKYSYGQCSRSDFQCNLPPNCKVVHAIFDGTEWCLLLVILDDKRNEKQCKLVLVSLKKELTYDVCSYKLSGEKAEEKYLNSEIKAVVAGDNLITIYRNNCKVFYLWTGEELASISCKDVSTVVAVEQLIAFHYQEGCLHVLLL